MTCRGNERREVFREDGDRERFLAVLGRTVSLLRWRLHAYVLMGNHRHLLVETVERTFSRGMWQINGEPWAWGRSRRGYWPGRADELAADPQRERLLAALSGK